MRASFGALDIIKRIISENVREGDICIDATAGRGNDTVFMCGLVGKSGRVYSFDIQPEAVESTRDLAAEKGFSDRAEIFLKDHSEMKDMFEKGTVSCITFNLGWLPKGDHSISTKKETTLAAIEAGLELLKPNGIMTIIIYYGRDTGFEEKDAVLEYLPKIDSEKFTVIAMPFLNRPNCPPIPIVIRRDADVQSGS